MVGAGLCRSPSALLVEIVPEDLRAGWVAQLAHRLGLDLPDALASHPVHLADLVEGLGLAISQAEAHRYHPGFALAEGVQYVVQLFLKKREAHGIRRNDRLRILDQV